MSLCDYLKYSRLKPSFSRHSPQLDVPTLFSVEEIDSQEIFHYTPELLYESAERTAQQDPVCDSSQLVVIPAQKITSDHWTGITPIL